MPTVSRQTSGRRRLRPSTQRSPSARARAGWRGAAAAAPGTAPRSGDPRRRLGWPTNLHVLLHHLLRGVSQEDVEVENSPDCPVSDGGRRLHGDLWRERTRRSVWDGPCPPNRREPDAGGTRLVPEGPRKGTQHAGSSAAGAVGSFCPITLLDSPETQRHNFPLHSQSQDA